MFLKFPPPGVGLSVSLLRKRRASMIAALCLLASAATAHAEGAWVLWVMSPTDGYARYIGDLKHDQCLDTAQNFALADARSRRLGQSIKSINKVNGAEVWSGGRLVGAYQCWPDTVDPSGAKAKQERRGQRGAA